MVCEHANAPELSGYADGELARDRERWWTGHLAHCPSCRHALARLRELREAVKRALPQREPSSALRDEVRRMLRVERPGAAPATGARRRWYLGLAATLLFAAGIGVGHVAGGGARVSLADEVVAGHVRSLEVDHLVDVESSEHHVVKPWFAGKLDFSPPVPELADLGFPLMGGRVDYLGGREVAALVYARGPHRINLLVWPAGAGGCLRGTMMTRQGFNLMRGHAEGMDLWAVSDLNRGELEEFVRRWQQAVAPDDKTCT